MPSLTPLRPPQVQVTAAGCCDSFIVSTFSVAAALRAAKHRHDHAVGACYDTGVALSGLVTLLQG